MIKQQKSRALGDLKRIIFHLDYKMTVGLLRRAGPASIFVLDVINRKLYCNTLSLFLQREIDSSSYLTNESLLTRLEEERKYLLLLPIIQAEFRGKCDIEVFKTIGFRLQGFGFSVRLRLEDTEIPEAISVPKLFFARSDQIQTSYHESTGQQLDIMTVFVVIGCMDDISPVYKVFAEAGLYLLLDSKTTKGDKTWHRFSFYPHGLTPNSELASSVNLEDIEL
ncbi:hypothetical protein QTV43_000340 [Vibrio vulnificus]|nr:hypothetical protein [Vibrio vulnificus]